MSGTPSTVSQVEQKNKNNTNEDPELSNTVNDNIEETNVHLLSLKKLWDSIEYYTPEKAKPIQVKQFKKELNTLYIGDNEMIPGLNFMFIKPFIGNSFLSGATIHSFNINKMQGQDVSEYSCSMQVNTREGTLVSKLDQHGILFLNAILKGEGKKSNTKTVLSYNTYEDRFNSSLSFGETSATSLSGDFKDFKFTFAHSRPLSERTQIGLEQKYFHDPQKGFTNLRGCVRYAIKDKVTINGEMILQADGLENKKKMKFGYFRKFTPMIDVGGEVTYNFTDRKSNYWFGVKKDNGSGTSFKFNVNDRYKLRMALEYEIDKSAQLMMTSEVDPFKNDVKFGVGVQFQSPSQMMN